MAKQKGILPLQGSIDNITFFKTATGYMARKRGGVSADRIANDPAFQRTRENNAEFGRAGKAGRLMRTSLRALINAASDSSTNSRLTREFMKVIQADSTSSRGERNVIDGEAELLKGFEFKSSGKLSATIYAPFTTTINRATGEIKVELAAFVPNNMIAAPAGASHFKLVAGSAAIDFEADNYECTTTEGALLPIDNNPTLAISLDCNLSAGSTRPLFLVFGIQFFQQVNGSDYQLKNGAFNALAMVDVNGV
jgi:hypothetical protein